MEKIRVLICTDSAAIHSGFGNVVRNIFKRLNATGKFELLHHSWFHIEPIVPVEWEIIKTQEREGSFVKKDRFGAHSFNDIIYKRKPAIVWSLGDAWMVKHIARSPYRNRYYWVHYFPIDGEPIMPEWVETIKSADYKVAFGQYGADVIKAYGDIDADSQIWHGIDTDLFKQIPRHKRNLIREKMFNVKEDTVVIGAVGRNQPRKHFPVLIETIYHILNGAFQICQDCGKVTKHRFDFRTRESTPEDTCFYCHSLSLTQAVPRKNIICYMHTPLVDKGWDLPEIASRYNLNGPGMFYWSPGLRITHGIPEEDMVNMYNTIDIFTLPTVGEGFGIPTLEAMACGTPVCLPRNTAHVEWASESGILFETSGFHTETMSNVARPIIDANEYIRALITLIDDKKLRERLGRKGIEQAQKMRWDDIAIKWYEIFMNAHKKVKDVKGWQILTS